MNFNIESYKTKGFEDPEWGLFVEESPWGHYAQTSCWAKAKACQGWQVIRLIFTSNKKIVCGAQILLRKLPVVGGVGYILKGPIGKNVNTDIMGQFIAELKRLCKCEKIHYLYIQPPDDGLLPNLLFELGFVETDEDIEKTATVLLDLKSAGGDLSSIKENKRKLIKKAQKSGVKVHQGDLKDIPVFMKLHRATADRGKFGIQSEEFFRQLWQSFYPHGWIHLLIAEVNGEPVTAKMMICFRDTVHAFRVGWSGEHADKYPNEAATWACIQWARKHNFKYYDFGGVDPISAQMARDGKNWLQRQNEDYTVHKLHYSDNVVFFPKTVVYIPNPLIKTGVNICEKNKWITNIFRSIYRWLRKR